MSFVARMILYYTSTYVVNTKGIFYKLIFQYCLYIHIFPFFFKPQLIGFSG